MHGTNNFIYRFFVKIAVISLVLTVVSAIAYDKLYIEEHVFSTPVLFAIILFFSLFMLFTFKSPDDTAQVLVTGWRKHALSIILLLCAGLIFYNGFYVPLNSRLVLEIPIEQQTQIAPLTFSGEVNKKYYLQVDYYSATRNTTDLKLFVSNDVWMEAFQVTINTFYNRASRITEERDLPFIFPENGMYKLTFEQEGDLESIQAIRIFVRD